MRKYASLFLTFACALGLAACGKMADPIALPRAEDITAIDISLGENSVSLADEGCIRDMIDAILSSEPTRRESIQDVPQTQSYIRIDFRPEGETCTLFAYEDRGKYYIERPYEGIYEIEPQLYERLREAVAVPQIEVFGSSCAVGTAML